MLLESLLATKGTYRRSRSDRMGILAQGIAFFLMSAYAAGVIVRGEYLDHRHTDAFPLALSTVAILMLGTVGVLQVRRANGSYSIDGGIIKHLGVAGHVRWEEPLTGLLSVEPGRMNYFWAKWLTLRWEDRSRRIELFQSLAQSLLESGAIPNNRLEPQRHE